ncbi:MAG: hypothetical protein SH847_10295 [Roseiflexaceae bacterium]|nr:hypothetical protein [Roseiflexaceae bacterium]
MLQRARNLRKKPQPPAAPPPKPHPLDSVLGRLGLPGVIIRQFLADFQELRPWWPILIPTIVVVALRTYRRERALIRAARSQSPHS